jgi:hypothetical protein
MNKKQKGLLFLLGGVVFIFVLALLLRSTLFIHGDFPYLIDQARDMLLVKGIAVDHKLTLIGARSGLGGVFHGPLWLYMLVPTFLLSHGDPFGTLVPMFLLIGMMTVLAGFFIGTMLYNKGVGFLFALLLTVSPPLISATMSSTNAQVMPLIFLLYLGGMILYLRGSNRMLVSIILLIGLGFHFESAFAVFLIPLTIIAMLLRWSVPKSKYIVIGVIGFALVVSNFLFFELRHQFLMSNALLQLFKGHVPPLKGYEQYTDIGFRTMDRLHLLQESYVTNIPQGNIQAVTITFVLLLCAAVVVGMQIRKQKKLLQPEKEYVFLFLIPVFYFILYIAYPMPLWPHYILPITISSAFLTALSFHIVFKRRETLRFVIMGAFLVLLLVPLFPMLNSAYLTKTPYLPPTDGSYLNQVHAAESVYKDAGKNEFGYFVYHPAVLTYSMDYLLWWLGKEKYHVTASNQKHTLTYLLMYPAPLSDKGAYDFWKKNVVKTNGQVLDHKVLNGGIIIEKLLLDSKDPAPDPNYYQNLIFR